MGASEEHMIALGYGEFTETKTGEKSVMIEVTNKGSAPINEVKVEWAYEYETPVEGTKEFIARHGKEFKRATGKNPKWAAETGRKYEFNPALGERKGPLGVEELRVFLFPPEWVTEMVSIVASLSPERYRVLITLDGQEEVLPGEVFGEFVSRTFGSR